MGGQIYQYKLKNPYWRLIIHKQFLCIQTVSSDTKHVRVFVWSKLQTSTNSANILVNIMQYNVTIFLFSLNIQHVAKLLELILWSPLVFYLMCWWFFIYFQGFPVSENVVLVDKTITKAKRFYFKNTATNLELSASANLIKNSIRAGVSSLTSWGFIDRIQNENIIILHSFPPNYFH